MAEALPAEMLTSYALQRDDPTPPRLGNALATRRLQLAASAFKWEDTVRCIDDLHYEIVPALKTLQTLFQGV